jgi:ornithine decarboxylase
MVEVGDQPNQPDPTLGTWATGRTPFYVLNRAQLVTNLETFRQALPELNIYYAMKANPEPAVLTTFASQDIGFEAASVYEVQLLQMVGVAPDQVIFGTAIKPAAGVKEVNEWGVDRFTADSTGELEKIASAAPGARIYIRVQVDDSGSVFPLGEKFGAQPEEVEVRAMEARRLGLDLFGLSFHVGSQATRVHAWAEALHRLAPLVQRLRAAGCGLSVINIGGGFPCQYATVGRVASIADVAGAIRSAVAGIPYDIRLMAEPGRFLVASAASLVVSVIARTNRAGRDWLFMDAGCYNGLFEAMSYQGSTRYPVVAPSSRPCDRLGCFNLAGPTGDVADVIARGVALPANLGEGDRLIFTHVGAYTMSMCVPFNGFPKPELLVV